MEDTTEYYLLLQDYCEESNAPRFDHSYIVDAHVSLLGMSQEKEVA